MILALLAPCSTIWATGKLFLSDLDNHIRTTPDRHIQGSYGHEKPGKVEF